MCAVVRMSDRRRLAARLALLIVGSPACIVPLVALGVPAVVMATIGPLVGFALYWLGGLLIPFSWESDDD